MADKYIQRSMQIQVSDASYIIRKALAEYGGELCIEAVISAMDQISNDLKHIGLQTLMTNEALNSYRVTAHGEVVKKE